MCNYITSVFNDFPCFPRIQEGDKIMVTAQVGVEWLEGELNGKKGRFPANFVDRTPLGLPQAKELAVSSQSHTKTVNAGM